MGSLGYNWVYGQYNFKLVMMIYLLMIVEDGMPMDVALCWEVNTVNIDVLYVYFISLQFTRFRGAQ